MYRTNAEEKQEFLFRWFRELRAEAISVSEDNLYLIHNGDSNLYVDRYDSEKRAFELRFIKKTGAQLLVAAYLLADSKEDAELQLKFLSPKINSHLLHSDLTVKKTRNITGTTQLVKVPVIFNNYKFNLFIKIDRLKLKLNGSLDDLTMAKRFLIKPYKGEK